MLRKLLSVFSCFPSADPEAEEGIVFKSSFNRKQLKEPVMMRSVHFEEGLRSRKNFGGKKATYEIDGVDGASGAMVNVSSPTLIDVAPKSIPPPVSSESQTLIAVASDSAAPPVSSELQTLIASDSAPPPVSSENKPKKKVCFKEDNLVEVFEFDDNVESKAVRKKFWEWFVLDRFRFKERVETLNPLLTPIFTSDHRNKVYSKMVIASNAIASTTVVSTTSLNNIPSPPPPIPKPSSPKFVKPTPSPPIPIPGGQRPRVFALEVEEVYAIWGEV